MSQLLSSVVISAVGLACKAFLHSGLCSITVSNLPVLLDALANRRHGQGLVSVSNHLSTLDDPLAWGILPFENFPNPRTIRWVLGASDIMFTNPLFSAFFRKGQVIETFRGHGIWQPAVDLAIERLNQGHWLHMFGEGKVHQPAMYPRTDGIVHLPRFKWGTGRIITEVNVLPQIIPMWLTGFDKLMPEHRLFPYKYLPRMGVQLSVTFGDPIPPDQIIAALKRPSGSLSGRSEFCCDFHGRGRMDPGQTVEAGEDFVEQKAIGRSAQMDEIRSEVTAIVQQAVEDLGRKVSGNTLDLSLPGNHRVR